MYKKALYVFFALLLATVIFGTQSAQATVNFPNTYIFATYTFSLDLDGNGELVTIIRYQNLDDNFEWDSSTPLEIPIRITSFSKEKANLTEVSVGDNYTSYNYSIRNYTISPKNSDSTYIHEYVIAVSPKSGQYTTFLKNQLLTIRTRTKIIQISSNTGDYSKFIFYLLPFPNKNVQSLIIKVNLPNDPYYWEEILDTFPKYDYRTSFGRGESIEWWYNENSNIMSPFLIDYKIHPDPMKLDLDKATMNSLYLGILALAIAIISIPSAILALPQAIQESRRFIKWLKEKWDNFL
jgi:hypothetical protein